MPEPTLEQITDPAANPIKAVQPRAFTGYAQKHADQVADVHRGDGRQAGKNTDLPGMSIRDDLLLLSNCGEPSKYREDHTKRQ